MVFCEPGQLSSSKYASIPDGFSHLIVDQSEILEYVLELGKRDFKNRIIRRYKIGFGRSAPKVFILAKAISDIRCSPLLGVLSTGD